MFRCAGCRCVVNPFAVWPLEATFGDAFIERFTFAQERNELSRVLRKNAMAFLFEQVGQLEMTRNLIVLKSNNIASMIIRRPAIFDKSIIRVATIRNQVARRWMVVNFLRCFSDRPRCQEQRSDTGYEETGYCGLGFIFSSIRSAHFTLASKGNFAHRGTDIAFA